MDKENDRAGALLARILVPDANLESHIPITPHSAPFIQFSLLLNHIIQTSTSMARLSHLPIMKFGALHRHTNM